MNPEEEGLIPPKPSVKAPANFTSPDELYKELEDSVRKYHPSDDLSLIRKAYEVALNSHGDQRRRSGEPYIIHPLCVAIILAELELDKESIAAGLLHDVLEDTPMTLKELIGLFGEEIAFLVDGVTKLTQINWDMDKIEIQAENLRKMFLAMAKDIRVIMVKLADRLHNMRTGQFWKPETQKQKARETLEIYSPLASRLGISKIKTELDDLSLMYLHPDVYKELTEKIYSTQDARERFIDEIKSEVAVKLEEAEIKAEISGRVKHLFSIYKKMVNQDKTLDQIYDIFAVRIIVDTVKDCYAALGVIHEMYHPITVRFKDYIAMPKPNMYQSLHTTLIAKNGQPFEIQIRTFEMHRTAEYGIAAHWKYKERGSGDTTVRDEEAKLSWLRQILEWQKDVSDNKEFISMVKNDLDLFSDNVYCFTPQGDVKNLPAGSTPIDFAYQIHSDVGSHVRECRINGQVRDIDTKLSNGDMVEIATSSLSHPDPRWLGFVRSGKARAEVRQYLRSLDFDSAVKIGRKVLEEEAEAAHFSLDNVSDEIWNTVMKEHDVDSRASLYSLVGSGKASFVVVLHRLQALSDEEREPNKTEDGIEVMVNGKRQSAQIARCCHPVWGDDICAFERAGHGITVHRATCIHAQQGRNNNAERWEEASWTEATNHHFTVPIDIKVNDIRPAILQATQAVAQEGSSIVGMNIPDDLNDPELQLLVQVDNRIQLMRVMRSLRQVSNVKDVKRRFESSF